MDAYTVSLVHGDGSDGSTVIVDETGKSWSASGNAQIDTAQSKFGGASILFDGTGDIATTADSADWRLDDGSNSNLWTVDLWVRFNGDPGATLAGFLQQRADSSNYWGIYYNNNTLLFYVRSGGSTAVSVSHTWDPASATWYHVAIVKNGTSGYMHFIDGTQIGSTTTDTDVMPDIAGSLVIGDIYTSSDVHNYLNGWMDEIRISKGVARWTANFTPPTTEYGIRRGNTSLSPYFMF